jgi:hypothetical protein
MTLSVLHHITGGVQNGVMRAFLASPTAWPSGTQINDTDAALSVAGAADFEWFGYSMGVYEKQLLVGAPLYRDPTRNRIPVGRLYSFAVGSEDALHCLSEPVSGRQLSTPLWTVIGTTEKGKLGAALAVGAPYSANDLVIALAISTSNSSAANLAGEVTARIFLYE